MKLGNCLSNIVTSIRKWDKGLIGEIFNPLTLFIFIELSLIKWEKSKSCIDFIPFFTITTEAELGQTSIDTR